jgi:uncharacterized protein (TIRG00374 family)
VVDRKNMQPSKPVWKGLLKLLGPLFFIFLFIRVVDLKTTAALLKEINLQPALLSVLLFPIVNGALAVRWWILCRRLGIEASFNWLFQIYYSTWFLSAIPLVGVSPLSKFIYLKEEGKAPGLSAVSIILDKLFDIFGLLAFGLFGLVYFPKNFYKGLHFGFAVVLAFFLMFAFLIFGKKIWKLFTAFLDRYANKKIRQIGRNLEADLAGFWSAFDVKFFLLMLGISIAIGLLRSLVLYLLAVSLKIQVSFGLIVACRALIGIVNVIPVTINGLGTRDAVLLLALPLAGVSKEAAIALSFSAFLWIIGSQFSGVVFWLKHPLPCGGIRAIKEK